jgi:hypothetical protein
MNSVYARAVRRAAELAGGRAKLARLLQVPESEIESWLAGARKPSRELFLRVVDIVIDDSGFSDDAGAADASPGKEASGASHAHYD